MGKLLELDFTEEEMYGLIVKDIINSLEGLTVLESAKVISMVANKIIANAVVQGE